MYVDSIFQEFKIFLRTEIVLVDEGFRLIIDDYNSSFINYELEPGWNYLTTDLILSLMKLPGKLNWL